MADTPQDDFFGTSYIGSNPYGSHTTDYLNQLASLHAMVSDRVNGGTGSYIAPAAAGSPISPTAPTTSATGQVGLSPNARDAQVNNPTNSWRATQAEAIQPDVPSYDPNNPNGEVNFSPAGIGYDYSGSNIPPDIQQLRGNLAAYLNGRVGQSQPNYSSLPGGNLFNLGTPMGANEAFAMSQNLPGAAASYLTPGMDTLSSLMHANASTPYGGMGFQAANQYGQGAVQSAGMFGSNAVNAANAAAMPAYAAFGQAMGPAANIAQTGGVNIAQLMHSLQAIQDQGQGNIDWNLANIREQYGKMGLGAGTDVASALAQGASTGQAQIESQQSSLLSSILQNAAQLQLGGVNSLTNIGQGYAGIGNNLAGTSLQAGGLISGANTAAGGLVSGAANNAGNLDLSGQKISLDTMLGAAGLLPSYANAFTGAAGQSMGTMTNLAQMNQQGNMYTNNSQYQNFLRQTNTLPPALQAALGLSTSFAPVSNQPSTGAALGSAALGAGGSIFASLIPFLFL